MAQVAQGGPGGGRPRIEIDLDKAEILLNTGRSLISIADHLRYCIFDSL